MRIYNKDYFPCKPNVLVPTFVSKKDYFANNLIAYLKDYKPLLTGQFIPKSIQNILNLEMDVLR